MNKLFTCILIPIIYFCTQQTIAQTIQAPAIQWSKVYGGTKSEGSYDIQQTTDGGYISAGYTQSNNNGTSTDAQIIKVDGSGNIQWKKTYGGSSNETAYSVRQTPDGGYIVAGYSSSNDGDVSGNHGNNDIWVWKIDNSGNIQWQKTYGGTANDAANAIELTSDGGYILSGYTYSSDGDVSYNHGDADEWIIKIDNSGNIQWQKTYGGTGSDDAKYIQPTKDGGYIITGSTSSNNGDISGYHGMYDIWVLKINNSGTILWQKCMGGSKSEYSQSIRQTKDGGYIVAGSTNSSDGDAAENYTNDQNGWVIKLSSTGNILWSKFYGGSKAEFLYSIQQTEDNGYISAGITYSNDRDVSGNHGGEDAWIIKLDDVGTLQWQKTVGGTDTDFAMSILQTSDKGYIFSGNTMSNNGDVSGNNGLVATWIVKLGAENNLKTENISVKNNVSIYPNPAKDFIYINLPETEKIKFININDLSGKLIKAAITGNKVDISALPAGAYFMNIETNYATYNRKFIKK